MKKYLFIILFLFSTVNSVEYNHTVIVQTSSMLLENVPIQYDSLWSDEIVNEYDLAGNHVGFIHIIFEHPHFKYNVNRKNKRADINDLVKVVTYMFKGGSW